MKSLRHQQDGNGKGHGKLFLLLGGCETDIVYIIVFDTVHLCALLALLQRLIQTLMCSKRMCLNTLSEFQGQSGTTVKCLGAMWSVTVYYD